MSDAPGAFCLGLSYRAARQKRLEFLARVLFLQVARVLGAQLLQSRFHDGKLVEVAVPCGPGELQLLDRGRDAAAQRVDLGLRLVLAQALAQRRDCLLYTSDAADE